MEENIIETRKAKTFFFNFDLLKYVDENLKYEIEFFTPRNDCLPENKIKNDIKQ